MADWPDAAELTQLVDVTNIEDWETLFDRVMAAAIQTVKDVRGAWDDDIDEPDEGMAQAALRMAELMATRPNEPKSHLRDATFRSLMFGKRRRFGIA